MARIKAIYGPLHTEEKRHKTTWHFSGVRANGEVCKWKLNFYYDTRCFKTAAMRGPQSKSDQRVQENLDLLPGLREAEPMDGLVTPMLRSRLKPEHIARATYLAMQHGRK